MKRFVQLLVILCMIAQYTISKSQDYAFVGSFDDCKTKAKQENKLILVDLYFQGCMPCKEMDVKVFPDEKVVEALKTNYILYKTDVFKDLDGKKIARKYAVSGFPTYIIIDAAGRALDLESGFMGVDRFVNLLNKGKFLKEQNKFLAFDADLEKEYPGTYNYRFLKTGENSVSLVDYLKGKDLTNEVDFVVSTIVNNPEIDKLIYNNFSLLLNKYGGQILRKKAINIAQNKALEYGVVNNIEGFYADIEIIKPAFNEKLWPVFLKDFITTYYKTNQNKEAYINMLDKYKEDLNWDQLSNYLGELLSSEINSTVVYERNIDIYLHQSSKEVLSLLDLYKLALAYAKASRFENAKNIINMISINSEKSPIKMETIKALENAVLIKNLKDLQLPNLTVVIRNTME